MTDAERLRSLAGAQFGPTRAALLAGAAALEAQAGQEGEIARLRNENARLCAAIRWALGEEGQFSEEPPPLNGKWRQRFWWRTELRERAGSALLSRAGAEEGGDRG